MPPEITGKLMKSIDIENKGHHRRLLLKGIIGKSIKSMIEMIVRSIKALIKVEDGHDRDHHHQRREDDVQDLVHLQGKRGDIQDHHNERCDGDQDRLSDIENEKVQTVIDIFWPMHFEL